MLGWFRDYFIAFFKNLKSKGNFFMQKAMQKYLKEWVTIHFVGFCKHFDVDSKMILTRSFICQKFLGGK